MELFEEPAQGNRTLGSGTVLLGGFARDAAGELLAAIRLVERDAPFRRMTTPGGWQMSVAMTNCGARGWTTDRTGYRYVANDPQTDRAWPAMPAVFEGLARHAAKEAGYSGFEPDACLINRYEPGARLSLHQDRNEARYVGAHRVRLSWPSGYIPVGWIAAGLSDLRNFGCFTVT